jgi:hypothetical protein
MDLARGTKRSLSSQIVSGFRRVDNSLDSFWAFVISIFSRQRTPPVADKGKLPSQSTVQSEPRKKGKWWKIPLEILAVVSAILGVTGFVLSTRSKLAVDVSGSLNPTNPLAAVFYVSNEGALPVHDVAATCGSVNAAAPKIRIIGPGERVAPESYAKILSPGHKLTLPCGHATGFTAFTNLTEAEIVIRVHYRPDWCPRTKTATFPWKAEKSQTGEWIWESIPD